MHDDMLERRLRAALRSEGDGLGMTITAAELERRLAIRRRRRAPLAALGIAAVISVSLLGVAAMAGGWFDRDPSTVLPVASATPVLSLGPSETTRPNVGRLPSLDELVAPLDPATIVRAQSMGPDTGRAADDLVGPRSVRFVPSATDVGTYRVLTACLGSPPLALEAGREGLTGGGFSIPIDCNGNVSDRQVHLGPGDWLELRSSEPGAWRFAVAAEPRVAWHAAAPDPSSILLDGWGALADRSSERSEPDYGAPAPGGGPAQLMELDPIPSRDAYRVLVSCAGPTSIRYVLGSATDGLIEEFLATEVECDGNVHEDELGVPLPNGATLYVAGDERTAWHIVVASVEPPVSMAPNGNGWELAIAAGPDLDFHGNPLNLSSLIEGPDPTIQVVVNCYGGSGVDVTVYAADTETAPIGSFRAGCVEDGAMTTAQSFVVPGGYFTVRTDPEGKMWLAVTVQRRCDASGCTPFTP